MRPSRLHRAVGKHEDAVGHADARKAVRDEDRRLTFAQLLEPVEHLEFGTRVQRRRRLVEDQHVGFAHIGARDRDLLPFAAGEFDAVPEALADHLLIAAGSLAITSSAWLRDAARSMRARSSRASIRPTAMLSAARRL